MRLHYFNQSFFNALLIISMFFVLTITSCNKEDGVNKETVENDRYYVKYVISAKYPRIFSNWYATTPDGSYSKDGYQTRYWEQTYGPVKKGFKCSAGIKGGEATISIYVSQNDEPFVLKASNKYSAHYVIDF